MAVPVPVTPIMCLCTIKGNLHSRRTDHDGRTCPAMGLVRPTLGASSAMELSWPIIISQPSVVRIAKGQENVTAKLTYGLSELVLRNTK